MSAFNVLSPAELGRSSVLPYAGAPAGIFSEDTVFRKLGPSLVIEFRDHLLRLDPEARTRRFGGGVAPSYIAAYAEKLREHGVTVLGCFVTGVLRGVAELHEASPWWGRHAEVAFSVEADHRGHGLGGELFRRIVAIAQNRWVRRIHMVCLIDNPDMRHLAESANVRLVYEGDMVSGILAPSVPTPYSVLSEYLDDVDSVSRFAWVCAGHRETATGVDSGAGLQPGGTTAI